MTTHVIKNEADAQLRLDVVRLANTNHGQAVLKAIMRECGYQKPSILANPQSGEINPLGTIYNEARRNLWLWLRKYVPSDKLAMIEIQDDAPVADELAGV